MNCARQGRLTVTDCWAGRGREGSQTQWLTDWGSVWVREGRTEEGREAWGSVGVRDCAEGEGGLEWLSWGRVDPFFEPWGVREREAWGMREAWGREEWQTALIGVLDRVDRSEGLQLQSAEIRERPRGAAECRSDWGNWRIEEWRRNLNIVRVFVILDSRFFNGFLYGSGLGWGLGFLIKPGPDPISNRTG